VSLAEIVTAVPEKEGMASMGFRCFHDSGSIWFWFPGTLRPKFPLWSDKALLGIGMILTSARAVQIGVK
jgi:hypothetical protein